MGQTGRIASADRVEMVPSGRHARSCGTDADRHVAHPRPEIRDHAAIEKHGTPHRLLCASIQRRPKERFATSGRPVEGVRPWHGSREAGNRHGDGFRHGRQAAQAQPAIVRPDRGHADRGAPGQARPHERGAGGERVEGAGTAGSSWWTTRSRTTIWCAT